MHVTQRGYTHPFASASILLQNSNGLPFLRDGAVKHALTYMRNIGLMPMCIKPSSLPPEAQSQGYNNFAKVLLTFWAVYCFAQGLTRSSDIARANKVPARSSQIHSHHTTPHQTTPHEGVPVPRARHLGQEASKANRSPAPKNSDGHAQVHRCGEN